LKGAGSVVAEPGGRAVVVPTGGPLLATGGTGDVLTGIVAARLAAGQDAFEAAVVAAWWHGATADSDPRAALGFGMLASELADGLPACAQAILQSEAGEACADRGDAGDGSVERDGILLRFPGP
jgi:NAD(P)H-hydrate repair Nnr-like enzyme with NAD(P)H-hydrate dehydratase domain